MKKRLLGMMIFILSMVVFTPLAHAEEVRVTVTPEQTELSESGNVRFKFSISNFSDYELSDIVIVYNGNSYEDLKAYVIPPSQSIPDYFLDLPVYESQLGTPIKISVTCVRNGEPIIQETTVTIARSADPIISITRTADKEMAREGDVIKLTYKLTNSTKFDMTEIMIIDENVSDSPIRQDKLNAGDSFSLDRQYTMGAESVVSAPVVTYTVNGKTKSFSGIEPLTLTSLLVRLTMTVDAGVPTAAGVNFTIEVKNTGNQDIKNITITDERNNPVNASPFSLKAKESTTFSYLVVPIMTEQLRNVKFTLKGTDSLEQPYTLDSPKSYEVYPFVDDSQINVSVRAETVTPWTSDAGKVTARIIITNHSSVTLTNVSVSETSIGVLKVYDNLPAGETILEQEIVLGSPRNLQFALKGTDPTGAIRDLTSCMLPVAYGTETDPAEATPAPELDDNKTNGLGFFSSAISKMLVVLGILMVLAVIVLIVLSVIERGRGSLFVRYDDDGIDEQQADDLDRIFDQYSRRDYHDDDEEVRTYTQRMRDQSTKRTARSSQPAYDDAPENGYFKRGSAGRERDAREYASSENNRPYRETFSASNNIAPDSAILLPPASGPEPQRPQVRVEYEDEYDLPRSRQSAYANGTTGAPMRENARQASAARYDDAMSHDPSSVRNEYEEESDVDLPYGRLPRQNGVDGGALHTPKVIVNKPQAATRPQGRNVVRRVHTDPKKD